MLEKWGPYKWSISLKSLRRKKKGSFQTLKHTDTGDAIDKSRMTLSQDIESQKGQHTPVIP